ncbi:MFS transporter [Allosalinactinospora lopnorensis]|uniref:MFS transporter n=1 Tax=Allosalinactinospora lopnorensis TaxID=1352348 RepID=UPI000623F1C8|nr:MFS transporter [Allosalinactinospora lopnorensis]
MVLLLSSLGATLTGRIGPVRTLALGFALLGSGTLLLLLMTAGRSYWLSVFPASTLIGIGVAFIFPAANIMAVNAVAGGRHGVTASLLATGQQAGGAIGLALVATVLYGTVWGAPGDMTPWALSASACYCLVGLLLLWWSRVRPGEQAAGGKGGDTGSR